jgi:hypothetical protein
MAKIPTLKTIRIEDFGDEQKGWIGTLLNPLNLFLTTVTNSLTSQLTFGDNIQGQKYLLDFTYQAATDLPIRYRNDLPIRPRALYRVSAYEDGLPVIVDLSWQLTDQNQIEIYSIVKLTTSGVSALTAGKRYRIELRTTP